MTAHADERLIDEAVITDEDRRAWREDGALRLRGVLSESWLALLRDGVEAAMAAPSPIAKEYGEGDAGRFFTDHGMFLRFEQFRRVVYESPLARLAAALMGASRINLYDEHLLVKEPGTETPTWWHHDLPYFRIQGTQIASFWAPLDPVTEATGALRFAVGSHRWGRLYRPVRIGRGDFVPETEKFADAVPDIDGDPASYPTLCFDLAPGDVAVFHGATLHAARGVPEGRRRAVSWRFTGDDVTWYPKRFSPTFYDAPHLVEGGPIDAEQFPRLWTA